MISIIVPIYNVEKYIVNCIKSIVDQDYKDFELLLVNDGTKDSSIELANDFLKDKKINYRVINKENGGLASARNAGIKEAKGEYIAFVDSDDSVSKDFLSNLLKEFENDIDFSFCNFEFVKEQIPPIDNNSKKMFFNKEELLIAFLRRSIGFVVPSMMFKKEFIINNNLFFDEDIKFSEDQPFIWNVILHSNKSVYLYKKMYGYYLRENSIMTSSSYDKIVNSYKEYSSYIKELIKSNDNYSDIMNMILPRWSLGTLYTSAKLLDYDKYKELYDLVGGKTILNKIRNINDRNSYLLAFVSKLSPKLLYKLCRSLKLE